MNGKGYFIDTINSGGGNLYTADQICRMVEFLIDNVFVKFGGCLFHQVIGIPMGPNSAPLLADLFLYSYERPSKLPRLDLHYREQKLRLHEAL